MKDLLYKELKLAIHPTSYIFLAMGAMLLIPAYPYFVAFFYTCLAIFFMFIQGGENKDIFFTTLLPVQKRDVVKARFTVVILLELIQILVSIPFAILGAHISPGGNPVGMEANVAFYGFVFLMYALFNAAFLPGFYKTAYKAGRALLISMTLVALYVVAVEWTVMSVPTLKAFLDTTDAAKQVRQIPALLVSMVIYGFSNLFACQRAAENFERVDL